MHTQIPITAITIIVMLSITSNNNENSNNITRYTDSITSLKFKPVQGPSKEALNQKTWWRDGHYVSVH